MGSESLFILPMEINKTADGADSPGLEYSCYGALHFDRIFIHQSGKLTKREEVYFEPFTYLHDALRDVFDHHPWFVRCKVY